MQYSITYLSDLNGGYNILDTRYTGCGKSFDAKLLMNKRIKEGKYTIFLATSYENLEEIRDNIPEPLRSQTIIYKGKTKCGKCNDSGEISNKYKVIIPKSRCKQCLTDCPYKNQESELEGLLRKEELGSVVLTTPQMLFFILMKMKGLHPLIIGDDVPISDILFPGYHFSIANFDSIKVFLKEKLGKRIKTILDISNTIVSGNFSIDYLESIPNLSKRLKHELEVIEAYINLSEFSEISKCPNFKFFYHLQHYDDKENFNVEFEQNFGEITIYIDNLDLKRNYQFIFLNATPSVKDRLCFESIGKLKEISKISPDNPNFTVIQINDYKNPKETLLNSTALAHAEVFEIDNLVKNTISFLNIDYAFSTNEEIYNRYYGSLKCEFIKFFGSDSRSTNQYSDIIFQIVLGAPIINPSYFRHPIFKNKNQQSVDSSFSKNFENYDIKSQIIQILARIMRKSPNSENLPKLAILFTSIEVTEEIQRNIGANVIKLSLKPTEKEKSKKKIQKIFKKHFGPLVFSKIFQDLDKELLRGSLELEKTAQLLVPKLWPLYSDSTIKRKIRENFPTEVRTIVNQKSSNKTIMINQRQNMVIPHEGVTFGIKI